MALDADSKLVVSYFGGRDMDRLWEVSDIVALVEAADAPTAKRGTYRKREKASI